MARCTGVQQSTANERTDSQIGAMTREREQIESNVIQHSSVKVNHLKQCGWLYQVSLFNILFQFDFQPFMFSLSLVRTVSQFMKKLFVTNWLIDCVHARLYLKQINSTQIQQSEQIIIDHVLLKYRDLLSGTFDYDFMTFSKDMFHMTTFRIWNTSHVPNVRTCRNAELQTTCRMPKQDLNSKCLHEKTSASY